MLVSSNGGNDGDVYVVENLGDSWGTPVNLGNGINTVSNDSHFTYMPDTKTGYMSGYHIVGSKASIDIYLLNLAALILPSE